ncbi:MAG: hypothetical protein R3E90_07750 [Marinicella sp.]
MKKFDSDVVTNLVSQIQTQLKNCKAKRNHIKLSLKENNIIKHINPSWSETLYGKYNGYGYENLGKYLCIDNFVKARNQLKKLSVKKVAHKKPIDTVKAWCNRLNKLTGLDYESCTKIARAKINYKESQILMMEDRQGERFSQKREKLVNKMRRENPLRRIKDVEHAQAILVAHDRHEKTDYEEKLNKLRSDASWGIIDYDEVRGMARTQAR